ncbi:class I SAM-dependent methyltransferase [Paenibacillus lactis]|uniref:Ubiquinone/menaquinone biosynthesis C-methylase UbiE n=1 Tax=Paenibacillus lactis TaxID=228574 RepID=A0ABS4F722_9BACL|nr:SAM-dependent methyltransferase [Paenibacillus lactis]MBP1892032.1 ubiquinone/menaquinone biosynthesis C-methylase UbiE [Paenibacillus lactis]MCM3494479.1 SAM-dependent methyltransferase [Paenibacillus lactis]HAF97385.1 SAM-dependent methyltransferase [Paenibacillus lactis]
MRRDEKRQGKTKLELNRVVFIGRTYEEYMQMFDLQAGELAGKKILDCPAGACSFTAHAAAAGLDVTASDIAYDHRIDDLERKGLEDTAHAMESMEQTKRNFVWDFYGDVAGVSRHRHQALQDCVSDMRAHPERYVAAVLPELPFCEEQFDLVLSAHFLFMYSDRLDYDFHRNTIRELLRVASEEVRIFPLADLSGNRYEYLERLIQDLEAEGLEVTEKQVSYEFMINGNSMLQIRKTR